MSSAAEGIAGQLSGLGMAPAPETGGWAAGQRTAEAVTEGRVREGAPGAEWPGWVRPVARRVRSSSVLRVAGACSYATAVLFGVAGVLVVTGGRYTGARVATDGRAYVLGTVGVLAVVAVLHLVVSAGAYLGRPQGAQSRVAAGAGLLGGLGLLGVVGVVPALVGTDREPTVVLAVLWSLTAVWLGLEALLVSAWSRVVAVAGQVSAGLWILLITVPTAGQGARMATVALSVAVYGVWAIGLGRLLRSSRARGLEGRSRLD